MIDEDYVEDEAEYEGITNMEEDESYYAKSEDEDEDLEKEYSKFFDPEEDEGKDVEYEFDSVVGARDKKPVMNVLNKTKLSKMEMDDLFNEY